MTNSTELRKAFDNATFIADILKSAIGQIHKGGKLKDVKAYVYYQLVTRPEEGSAEENVDANHCKRVWFYIADRHTKARFESGCNYMIADVTPSIAVWARFMDKVRECKKSRAEFTVETAHAEALEFNARFDMEAEAMEIDRAYETFTAAERMYCLQYAETSSVAASVPAFDVYDMGVEVLDLTRRQMQQIEFALPYQSRNHGTLHKMFKMGSVATYAVSRGLNEVEQVDRAIANGHALYFMYGLGASLTSHQRPREFKVLLKDGQLIRHDGLVFKAVVRGEHVSLELQGI